MSKLELLLGKAAFVEFTGSFWMGRRFSVRVQLQPGVLGKVWSESAAACSSIPLLEQFQSHNSPFLWDFVVTAGQLGCPGAAPQHIPPLSTVKNKSLIILSPKIPVKPWLCQEERGSQTLPGVHKPLSPSPDGVAGPSTGSVLVVLVLYWFCTGPVLVPSAQVLLGLLPPAPVPCCSIPKSQFPNPKSLFSPPRAPTAPC